MWVRVRSIRRVRAILYATDNGNTRYQIYFRSPRRPQCGRALLRLGAHAIASNGWGHDDESCSVSFELDRPLADLAAAHFSIPRQDRHAIGRDLRGAFVVGSRSVRSGDDVEVTLSIHNPPGAPPIMRYVGGRQRGPRNNRFTFVIQRDGRTIASIDAPDFGGLGGFTEQASGTTGEVREHLSRWGDISVPGRYVVKCRYDTELAPAGVDAFDDANRGKVWDRAFEGVIRFTVR